MLTAGCSTEKAEPNPTVSLTVSVEAQGEPTRTYLSDGQILWSPGDAIRVISADGRDAQTYTLSSGANTARGTFTGPALASATGYAFSPAGGFRAQTASGATFTLPAEQAWTAGTLSPTANPMFGTAGSDALQLRNLCGVLKLRLTGTATIASIEVASAGETLCGEAAVAYGSAPAITLSGTGTSVRLTGIAAALDPTTPTDFYIVLPPADYRAGMRFTITDSNGNTMVKTASGAIRVIRSRVCPLKAFEYTGNHPIKDKAFNDFLVSSYGFATQSDGYIDPQAADFAEKCEKVTTCNMFSYTNQQQITTLEGIEFFPKLRILAIVDAPIEQVDLTSNPNLTELYIAGGLLTQIDLSHTPQLTQVVLYGNRLSTLDLSSTTGIRLPLIVGNQTDGNGSVRVLELYLPRVLLENWNSTWSSHAKNVNVNLHVVN